MLQGPMVGICRVMKQLVVDMSSRVPVDQEMSKLRPTMNIRPIAFSMLLLLAFSPLPTLAAGPEMNALKLVKIANDGTELPETVALGTKEKDWACTLDRTTGLIWEVKTTSGLRNQNNSYTWYNSAASGRAVGSPSGGFCATDGRCDTEKYIADVNSSRLCGASDWRMPQTKELEAHFASRIASPIVYTSFFPNTSSTYYWTGTPGAYYSFSAWAVYISDAQSYYIHRTGSNGIRAVRTSK